MRICRVFKLVDQFVIECDGVYIYISLYSATNHLIIETLKDHCLKRIQLFNNIIQIIKTHVIILKIIQ